MRQQENQQRNKRRTVDLSAAAEYLPWPVIEVRAYDDALTRIGATATDPRPAYAGLQSTMREVCALGAFAVGHVYLSIPRRGHLVPAHLWRFSYSARFGPFVRVTMATILAPGVGLPGQAAATGSPACIASIDNDDALLRAQVARAVGLRSAYAFPVIDEGVAVAVLEFLAVEPRRPDPGVAALLGGLVDVVTGMLTGRDFEELLRHEVALAEAADLIGHGSVGSGALP